MIVNKACLSELSEAATQGEWHHRQAGKANSGGPLDWIGDAPDGSAHTKIIVGRQCLYGGSDDYAFVARLVSDYRAGRLIAPTAMAEAVASARAEGWQPIETAPRDGTVIGVEGGAAYWSPTCGWVTAMGQDAGREIQWTVTHWKSLAPPTLIPGGSSDV